MENKKETMKELDPDQMEKVSGGAEFGRVCHICGKVYDPRKDPMHAFNCVDKLLKVTHDGDN